MTGCNLLDGEMPTARQNGKRLPCERLYAEKEELLAENAKLREHIADLWEFGFSKNAGANSIKEYLRKVDELRDRTYELLGVAK